MTAPAGVYRNLDLSDTFARLPEVAVLLRPVIEAPEDPDPSRSVPTVHLAALGTKVVSTEHSLVPLSSLPIWDVNGYYRALGLGWPYRPSRAELRRAYQRVNGQASEYVTHALKRLLDPVFRAHYDRRPLGQPVDDQYRWGLVKRQAALWAAAQALRLGRPMSFDDFLGERLTRTIAADPSAIETTDPVQAHPTGVAVSNTIVPWPYAYYQFGSRKRDDDTLARWQRLLIEAFRRGGLSVQVAVGYLGARPSAAARVWHRTPEGPIEIIFLHEDTHPTDALADDVVALYYNYPHRTPLIAPLYIDT